MIAFWLMPYLVAFEPGIKTCPLETFSGVNQGYRALLIRSYHLRGSTIEGIRVLPALGG
jgi:hypothetical protein